ncbi:MAG: hypothetical protein IPN01_24445 [Deltaproteobacteria bacterium]|nr:hypothetical protein [Deltaproteobacteria bacterium]
MAKDQLVPLGYAPVFKNGKGGLVVDTDSLRRGGAPRRDRADGDFDGEDDDDFDGEDDDDFDGEDDDFDGEDDDFDGEDDDDFDGEDDDDFDGEDDDDFDGEDDDDFDGEDDDDSEDDGDEDSDDDNTDDEEDFEMSDDFGRRKRRNKNNGSGRGGRGGRGQREPVLRRNQDRDGDGQRDGGLMQRRRDKKSKSSQEWVGTIVGDTETLTGAGTATVRVVLQHDFIADELNFTGSRSDAKVTSVVFGERTIFNNSKGIAVGAFTSTTRSKGTIAGQYLRAGLTISVSGSLGGAGDFAVAIPGQKPLVC